MESESSPISDQAPDVVSLPIYKEQTNAKEALDSGVQKASSTDDKEHLSSGEESPAEALKKGPLTGYELVADMMRRQDEVIEQIDELNSRIEEAIKEISDARKAEQAEEQAALLKAEAAANNEQQSSVSKAA